MRRNEFDSQNNTECSAFTTLLETLRVPFTWYTDDALVDRYRTKLKEQWYDYDEMGLEFIGVEVGGTLVVFELKSGRFVLVDAHHGKQLESSFATVADQADAGIQVRKGERLERDEEGNLVTDRDWCERHIVTPHEVSMASTVTNRIEQWVCDNAGTILFAQHGLRNDPDDRNVIADITVFKASEDMERDEDEIFFAYQDEHTGKEVLSCVFPARYMWSKDWHGQLKADTEAARKARQEADVERRRREVESKRMELKRLEANLEKLKGGQS